MRGGVEGRLEFFQKFIPFGGRTLPLADCPDKKGISKNQKSIKTIPFRNLKSQETNGSLYPPNIKSSEKAPTRPIN